MSDHDEEELLEGGSTSDESSTPIDVIEPRDVEKHRQLVTLTLVGLLAFIIVGHYACILVLEFQGGDVKHLNSAFNAVLPVVSGLVGSAVTYYFTRSRRN